jgi:hypothetical protein
MVEANDESFPVCVFAETESSTSVLANEGCGLFGATQTTMFFLARFATALLEHAGLRLAL